MVFLLLLAPNARANIEAIDIPTYLPGPLPNPSSSRAGFCLPPIYRFLSPFAVARHETKEARSSYSLHLPKQ